MADLASVVSGLVDRGPWMFFDSLKQAAGATLLTSYSVFQTPMGQGDPYNSSIPKTKVDTNMERSGQFAPPRTFRVDTLGFHFTSSILKADMDAILESYFFEFRIGDKIFMEGPIWSFPGGFGTAGVSTKTDESSYSNGLPTIHARRQYGPEYGRMIQPMQSFSLNFVCSTSVAPTLTSTANGGKGLNLYSMLDGIVDRAVQ